MFELETEGPTGAGDGLYGIEVRDGSDAVLFTRFFTVDRTVREDEGAASPPPDDAIVRFSELVPVQANAAKLVVFAGNDEVGEIEPGGTTPVVTLTSGFSRAGGAAAAGLLVGKSRTETAPSTLLGGVFERRRRHVADDRTALQRHEPDHRQQHRRRRG